MIGMLIGLAALSAWGLYRFNQHLANLTATTSTADMSLAERLAHQLDRYREAYVAMYGDIFTIAAVVCIVGALLGLLISGRREHADEIPGQATPATTSGASPHPVTFQQRSTPGRRRRGRS